MFISLFADFGLAMLFFLAGREIDFAAIRGAPIVRAGIGWLVSLAIGIALGLLIEPGAGAAFVAVALGPPALGAPCRSCDASALRTPFGVSILAIGAAVGEFGPLLAISLFLSGRTPLHAALVLLAFAVIAGVLMFFAARGDGVRLHRAIEASLHTSGQFVVRLVMFVLLSLVALSIFLGIDMLLGAFAAGVLGRAPAAGRPAHDAETTEAKIEAVDSDCSSRLLHQHGHHVRPPRTRLGHAHAPPAAVFTLLLLVSRGIPRRCSPRGGRRCANAWRPPSDRPARRSSVAVTALGVDAGDLDSGMAAALVGAGLLSVLAFPLVALAVRTGNWRPRQESNLRPRD